MAKQDNEETQGTAVEIDLNDIGESFDPYEGRAYESREIQTQELARDLLISMVAKGSKIDDQVMAQIFETAESFVICCEQRMAFAMDTDLGVDQDGE